MTSILDQMQSSDVWASDMNKGRFKGFNASFDLIRERKSNVIGKGGVVGIVNKRNLDTVVQKENCAVWMQTIEVSVFGVSRRGSQNAHAMSSSEDLLFNLTNGQGNTERKDGKRRSEAVDFWTMQKYTRNHDTRH